MRRHALMRHGAPRMIARSRLREPDIACIACELAGFQRTYNGVAIHDLPACRVDDVRATLHLADHLLIEKMLRFRVQRTVDSHDIAYASHRFSSGVPRRAKFALDRFRQTMTVGVMQLDVEGLEPAQHCRANPPGRHGPHVHPFKIVSTRDAIGNIPATLLYPFM